MKDMLYGDIPDFERVMSAVKELEKEKLTHFNFKHKKCPDYSIL